MDFHTVEVDADGNMTLPFQLLEDLGVEEGGKLLLERQANQWFLKSADDLHRLPSALSGYLHKLAPMTPDQLHERTVDAIAAENIETLRQIKREHDES